MTSNPKSLRNDEERKGILIAPLKLPRFSLMIEIPVCFFTHDPQ